MNYPNVYLFAGETATASARMNLKNIIYGFGRRAESDPFGYVSNYGYWVHLERFWSWFKKFKRGGWLEEERTLQEVMEEVTFRHYPGMTREEIDDEVKRVLATFLFERGSMSVVETEKLARFVEYVSSMLVALG